MITFPPTRSIFSRLLLTSLITLSLTACLDEHDSRDNDIGHSRQDRDTGIPTDSNIPTDTTLSQDTTVPEDTSIPSNICAPGCADNENCIDNKCVISPMLALGSTHTCAWFPPQNDIYCWGANHQAQLGQGNTGPDLHPKPLPVHIDTTDSITGIYASVLQTCVTTNNPVETLPTDQVWCWGSHHALPPDQKHKNPTQEPERLADIAYMGEKIKQLTLGNAHNCSLSNQGGVRCWGSSHYGQLGSSIADVNGSLSSVEIKDLLPSVQITAGNDFTCALTNKANNATVYCWGDNAKSKLGQPTTISRSKEPLLVPGLDNVFAVQTNSQHTCAILNDEKTIKCWGNNDDGQLGTGDEHPTSKPLPPTNNIEMVDVKQLALGTGYTCVLFYSGQVACSGSNVNGQLGGGSALSKNQYNTFQIIPNFKNVHRLVSSAYHICAIHDDNEISCWGSNDRGQVGLEGGKPAKSPTKVSFN